MLLTAALSGFFAAPKPPSLTGGDELDWSQPSADPLSLRAVFGKDHSATQHQEEK